MNGKDVDLTGWTPDSAIQLKNRIGVRCVGKTIEIYAQGKLLKRVEDTTFTSGLIGFILTEDGEGIFDDLFAEAIR